MIKVTGPAYIIVFLSLAAQCGLGTSCAVLEAGDKDVKRDGQRIASVLAQENASDEKTVTVEPVDLSSLRPESGPDGEVAPEESTSGGLATQTQEPAVDAAGQAASQMDTDNEALRQSAVDVEVRAAIAHQLDGFGLLDSNLGTHIKTAPFLLYKVTRGDDSGVVGTLRYGLESAGPAVIVFDHTVFADEQTHTLTLDRPVFVANDKTVISLAGNIRLVGPEDADLIVVKKSKHVILKNLVFAAADPSAVDGAGQGARIRVTEAATNVWIDQNRFEHCPGPCILIDQGFAEVRAQYTLSRNHFDRVSRGVLLEDRLFTNSGVVVQASPPGQEKIKASIYDNVFDQVSVYGVLARYSAYAHAFNNLFLDFSDEALVAEDTGRIYSESNVFDSALAGAALSSRAGCIKSDLELLLGQAVRGNEACVDDVTILHPRDEPHSVEAVDTLAGTNLQEFENRLRTAMDAIPSTLLGLRDRVNP